MKTEKKILWKVAIIIALLVHVNTVAKLKIALFIVSIGVTLWNQVMPIFHYDDETGLTHIDPSKFNLNTFSMLLLSNLSVAVTLSTINTIL
ncbi:MAG: hypothetical protein RL757_357 [Bacteroidota bacterium]|jgi:hypothetical protein